MKKLTEAKYKRPQKPYSLVLTRGQKEVPPIPPRQKGKRGRTPKSDTHILSERLKTHETAVSLSAKLPHVDFSNNCAERDLQMGKVKK